MKKILYYGNCQPNAIKELLVNVFNEYDVTVIFCWVDTISKDYILEKVREADIIITQPIHHNYRGTDYLHTEFILENANMNTEIFIFPSLHFEFYYFDYKYKLLKDNVLLKDPSDYHYHGLINIFKDSKNTDVYLNEYVNNINLKSYQELENMANNSINELRKREQEMISYHNVHKNCNIIIVSDYIKENYKKELLFYSINHPTKYILQYIAKYIINKLSLEDKINYNIDPFYSSERGMIYKCISQVVEFDINKHLPYLNKYRIENFNEIINHYLESYKKYVDHL